MNISTLEIELDKLIQESDIPAEDFGEAIASLAENQNWNFLQEQLGVEVAGLIQKSYEADPKRFCREFREAASDCRHQFVVHASKRLARLSQSNFANLEPSSIAETLQITFENKEQLLTAAFAYKLIGMIKPATSRALELRELVLSEASSQEADDYLSEACECYFLGLYTACAVMCRSLLEEALEKRLPKGLLANWKAERAPGNQQMTLGTLLYKVKRHLPLCVDSDFLFLAGMVNNSATKAAHTKAIGQEEARKCLVDARKAFLHLMGDGLSVKDPLNL